MLHPAGVCRKSHQSLQKYEKTENHLLVCADCAQRPQVRNSRSQEHCARKCKVKKSFSCRWVSSSSLQSHHTSQPRSPHSLTHSIYIFLLFIIWSSLNYFLRASSGLSTSSGATGNATCFPLTASPTVCRSRPTSTLLCTKKKVKVTSPKSWKSQCDVLGLFFFSQVPSQTVSATCLFSVAGSRVGSRSLVVLLTQ